MEVCGAGAAGDKVAARLKESLPRRFETDDAQCALFVGLDQSGESQLRLSPNRFLPP
jgi:hypothetical protein